MVSRGKHVPLTGPIKDKTVSPKSKPGWRAARIWQSCRGKMLFSRSRRLVAVRLKLLAKNEANTEANHDQGRETVRLAS